jgi:hypothetical protein
MGEQRAGTQQCTWRCTSIAIPVSTPKLPPTASLWVRTCCPALATRPIRLGGSLHLFCVHSLRRDRRPSCHSSSATAPMLRGIGAGITESQTPTEACIVDTTTGSAGGLSTRLAARCGKPRRRGLGSKHQVSSPSRHSSAQACGAGPYYFPWPNVGFFCQQHKHVSASVRGPSVSCP